MSSPDPHRIVLALYEERLKNDSWALRELMHRDAVWEILGGTADGTPIIGGGSSSAMASFVDEVLSTWHWIDHDFDDVLVSGETLACRYHVTIEHVPTKRRTRTQGADFFRMKDGFAHRITSFADPSLIRLFRA